ncbi:CGNR zinc finger domain-containing protein [Micromonospora sp. NBC_01796]|uniref:CGNR zinc finger domain-containing protein n=1 Tax=Micromonospora sp. NBC_01796 TaxID=2975987 RepID=UPI002DDB288D|nr:CGNR zinc finger domain-containing protein [Micromonospora sp. NBC_01796]WSA85871.1 CGNR zinc finger domain-containing protein [Micromonospora sp. NBC_01796]
MSWMATGRYGLRAADTGAALIQDLINTRALDGAPDLLSGRGHAQEWWDRSVRHWASVRGVAVPDGDLSDEDAAALRRLRTTFERLIEGGELPSGATPGVAVTLVPGEDGMVRPVPSGRGTEWLASALWSETLLAQQSDTWSRIKLCRNETCRTAFYDASRNRSGVWHDVSTCGNVANLRAARERKRRTAADRDR